MGEIHDELSRANGLTRTLYILKFVLSPVVQFFVILSLFVCDLPE